MILKSALFSKTLPFKLSSSLEFKISSFSGLFWLLNIELPNIWYCPWSLIDSVKSCSCVLGASAFASSCPASSILLSCSLVSSFKPIFNSSAAFISLFWAVSSLISSSFFAFSFCGVWLKFSSSSLIAPLNFKFSSSKLFKSALAFWLFWSVKSSFALSKSSSLDALWSLWLDAWLLILFACLFSLKLSISSTIKLNSFNSFSFNASLFDSSFLLESSSLRFKISSPKPWLEGACVGVSSRVKLSLKVRDFSFLFKSSLEKLSVFCLGLSSSLISSISSKSGMIASWFCVFLSIRLNSSKLESLALLLISVKLSFDKSFGFSCVVLMLVLFVIFWIHSTKSVGKNGFSSIFLPTFFSKFLGTKNKSSLP